MCQFQELCVLLQIIHTRTYIDVVGTQATTAVVSHKEGKDNQQGTHNLTKEAGAPTHIQTVHRTMQDTEAARTVIFFLCFGGFVA